MVVVGPDLRPSPRSPLPLPVAQIPQRRAGPGQRLWVQVRAQDTGREAELGTSHKDSAQQAQDVRFTA